MSETKEVIIYQRARHAMQSGIAKTKGWFLEYKPISKKENDPLMGWVGQGDTLSQLKIEFKTVEEAIAFAQAKNLSYSILKAPKRNIVLKAYSDNFASHRKESWTH